jgi:hypothetical protein
VVTLESILDLIPDNIQDLHLKVDTEGYDLEVLRGARDSIRRFQTVIIECSEQDKSGKTLHYDGQCLMEDAQPYMEAFDFSTKWEPQGDLGNLFFYNTKLNQKIPQMLKHSLILENIRTGLFLDVLIYIVLGCTYRAKYYVQARRFAPHG